MSPSPVPKLLTINTSWPGDIREYVVLQTSEAEASEVVVVFESVVLRASIAHVLDCLSVCWGIGGVPHQLQVVLGRRGGWVHTVRPFI